MNKYLSPTHILTFTLAALFASQSLPAADPPTTAPAPKSKWKLLWSDEFNAPTLDKSKWTFDLGNGFYSKDADSWIYGWGNNEEEFYTDRPVNAFVQDGFLHIRAIKESYQNANYTSARLVTRGLFSKAYGRFEFRAKLPTGKGLWPAIWLLPQDNAYGPWASSGEIDILEARGQLPTEILGTLHYGSRWPANDFTESDYTLPNNSTIADLHTYALEWEPGELRWYVDDHLYSTKRHWWSSSKTTPNHEGVKNPDPKDQNPWPAPFDKPFYIILNLAVGGNFLGSPNAKTVFPQDMQIDYVRVYDKIDGYGPTPPPGKNEGNEEEHFDAPGDDQKNLAANKPATASSEQLPDNLASKANDSNNDSRWCAANGDVPQWWQVDLQKPADLAAVKIKWEMNGRNYQYIIEGSPDAKTWQTLSDQSHSTRVSQIQTLPISAQNIRYVRLRITALDPLTWASINEIKILKK